MEADRFLSIMKQELSFINQVCGHKQKGKGESNGIVSLYGPLGGVSPLMYLS